MRVGVGLSDALCKGLPLGGRRLDAAIEDGSVRLNGLREGMALDRRPREPLTNLRYGRLNTSVPGGLDD